MDLGESKVIIGRFRLWRIRGSRIQSGFALCRGERRATWHASPRTQMRNQGTCQFQRLRARGPTHKAWKWCSFGGGMWELWRSSPVVHKKQRTLCKVGQQLRVFRGDEHAEFGCSWHEEENGRGDFGRAVSSAKKRLFPRGNCGGSVCSKQREMISMLSRVSYRNFWPVSRSLPLLADIVPAVREFSPAMSLGFRCPCTITGIEGKRCDRTWFTPPV